MRNSLIETLMRRDGISREDAQARYDEFAELLQDPDITFEDLEQEMLYEFGLEPDYLEDFLL